jgi:hypothetical protein
MTIKTITSLEAYKLIRKPLPKPAFSFKNKKKYNRKEAKKID